MTVNEEDRVFEALLDYLHQTRGFDFTGYKRTTLKRRVKKRMQTNNIQTFGDYLDYLEVHPEEFNLLFNTILINVTRFFRDPEAWEHLQNKTLPYLLDSKPIEEPLRVWSAGCASGEEAYTMAIVLAEMLGIEQFQARVKIYATDIDEEALAQARQASYTAKDLESVPEILRQRYFERSGDLYIFRSEVRRAVIFGRHDLLQDAPISRLDLLVCRNVLMYFNGEIQARIIARFHFALQESGVLFLGKAEMLLSYTNLFTPLNLEHHIFRKVPNATLRDRLPMLTQRNEDDTTVRLANNLRLRDAAFNAVHFAQIVVDFKGNLVLANALARSSFHINLQDIGRPLQDLEISYRPLELRSRIEEVYQTRNLVRVSNVVRHKSDGAAQYLDVELAPLLEIDSDPIGVSITFIDVTPYHELGDELQRSNQELETANEELQSTNEELETTNEELQSTNEELETTNEELQSTNEELETMNEELQSTNEELQTINDELRRRTSELNNSNAFLNSIFASLQSGAIVVDSAFQILSWNETAKELWGLRFEEVEGQSIFGLDIGLPVDRLRDPIRNCLAGQQKRQEIVLDATNRRGRAIQCRVTLSPLLDHEKQLHGVILMIEGEG